MFGLMWRSTHEERLRSRRNAHAFAMERMMADNQKRTDNLKRVLNVEIDNGVGLAAKVNELGLVIEHLDEMLQKTLTRVSTDERFRLLNDLIMTRNLMQEIVDRF